MLKRLNLQFFADQEPEDKTPEQPEAKDDTTTAAEPEKIPDETNQAGKTFTQAELDEIIAKRLEREKGKKKELEDKLAKLAEYEKAEEERRKAEMSEVERLQAEYEEAQKKLQEYEESSKQAKEQAEKRIIETEIKSIARSLNANDPDDVLALIDRSNITIDENGNVTGVNEVLSAFKEAKPFYFKQPIGADAAGGSNPGKNPSANELTAKEKELAEAKEAAKSNPRLIGRVTQLYNEVLQLKKGK
ncbi:phage scaffolding protein [Terribacillus sp. 179-K 1B1 HS]|uniref:phage scaffolding protein n=1 Tax=Terribacillus sp. 179-K 1B1 HS TaxID=3142388 RepID=UPI00399F6F4B